MTDSAEGESLGKTMIERLIKLSSNSASSNERKTLIQQVSSTQLMLKE